MNVVTFFGNRLKTHEGGNKNRIYCVASYQYVFVYFIKHEIKFTKIIGAHFFSYMRTREII